MGSEATHLSKVMGILASVNPDIRGSFTTLADVRGDLESELKALIVEKAALEKAGWLPAVPVEYTADGFPVPNSMYATYAFAEAKAKALLGEDTTKDAPVSSKGDPKS